MVMLSKVCAFACTALIIFQYSVSKACAFKDKILMGNESSCFSGPAVCVSGGWVAGTWFPTAKTESKSEPKSLSVFQDFPFYSVAEPQRSVSRVIKTKPRQSSTLNERTD